MPYDDPCSEFEHDDGVPGTSGMSLLVTTAATAAALAVGLIGVVLALPPDGPPKRTTVVASNSERVRQTAEEAVLKKTPEVGLEHAASKADLHEAFFSAKQRHQAGSDTYVAALVTDRNL